MSELTCREAIEFLMDYLEGTMEDRPRQRFDSHLEACEACRNYLSTYQMSVQLGRQALREDSEELPAELVNAIMAARTGRGGD